MSTEYYYAGSDNLSSDKKSSRVSGDISRGKIEKGLKRLLIIAAVIFAVQLIWLFGISPFIPFSTVDIHGFSSLHRAEIISLAGLDENSSFISTNTKIIQEKLSSHILVESAVVMKHFPDRLSIHLNPRIASAYALTSVNSRQAPIFIDRHGVFFKIEESGAREGMEFPVLSGIENPQLGMRLPSSLIPLVMSLNKMASSSPELLAAISEIRIERKTLDGYDLVLFPVHSPIRVRVENNLTEDMLRYVLLMLNVFNNDAQKPEEIDFRSGIGSYKVKEQSL